MITFVLISLLICFSVLVSVSPIGSLFVFLAIIVLSGVFLMLVDLSYLGFLLISIYGGAIVVPFSMVLMLLNKKIQRR